MWQEPLWIAVAGLGFGAICHGLAGLWKTRRGRRFVIHVSVSDAEAPPSAVCGLPDCGRPISEERLRRWPWVRTCSPQHETRLKNLSARERQPAG